MMTRSNCSAVGITSSRSGRARRRVARFTVAPAGAGALTRSARGAAPSGPARRRGGRAGRGSSRRPSARSNVSVHRRAATVVAPHAPSSPAIGAQGIARARRGGSRRRRPDRRPRRSRRRRSPCRRPPSNSLDGDRHVADVDRLADGRRRRRVVLAGDAQQLHDACGEDRRTRIRRRGAAGCGCARAAGYGEVGAATVARREVATRLRRGIGAPSWRRALRVRMAPVRSRPRLPRRARSGSPPRPSAAARSTSAPTPVATSRCGSGHRIERSATVKPPRSRRPRSGGPGRSSSSASPGPARTPSSRPSSTGMG